MDSVIPLGRRGLCAQSCFRVLLCWHQQCQRWCQQDISMKVSWDFSIHMAAFHPWAGAFTVFHVQPLYSLTAVVARSIWTLFVFKIMCVPIACVYLCIYAFCVCLSIHIYMCESGQGLIDSGCFIYSLPCFFFFETGFLTELGAHQFS